MGHKDMVAGIGILHQLGALDGLMHHLGICLGNGKGLPRMQDERGHINALAESRDIDIGQKSQNGANHLCIRLAHEGCKPLHHLGIVVLGIKT